ncbi:hypothetical protein GUJ93_ZPchr0016g2627 [Zizania palustris]|uniref:Uncharacterized protein n=1 Tax=Zizania palustris TaxID=103762 RepID=A0A8J5VT21_ZIZPA|nr:hypothetical protein GUJ93_ZPchr0016g2627 [Zizania palustris]
MSPPRGKLRNPRFGSSMQPSSGSPLDDPRSLEAFLLISSLEAENLGLLVPALGGHHLMPHSDSGAPRSQEQSSAKASLGPSMPVAALLLGSRSCALGSVS